MNHLLKSPLMAAVSALLLTAPLLTSAVQATEEVEQPNPLRFYQGDNDSFLQASVGLDLAYFSMDNAWYGNDRAVIGSDIDHWWESLVRLGLEGSYTLPNSQTFYAKVDAVQANTFGGIDVGGTNDVYGDVSSLRFDKAYAGWRSGQLFSSLGEDFLDISLGRQLYTVGNGFLFASQGQGGGKRAAWYLGGRRSADFSTIIRMHSGPWSGDLFYFEEDRMNDFEKGYFCDQNTKAGGATMEYAFSESACRSTTCAATSNPLLHAWAALRSCSHSSLRANMRMKTRTTIRTTAMAGMRQSATGSPRCRGNRS